MDCTEFAPAHVPIAPPFTSFVSCELLPSLRISSCRRMPCRSIPNSQRSCSKAPTVIAIPAASGSSGKKSSQLSTRQVALQLPPPSTVPHIVFIKFVMKSAFKSVKIGQNRSKRVTKPLPRAGNEGGGCARRRRRSGTSVRPDRQCCMLSAEHTWVLRSTQHSTLGTSSGVRCNSADLADNRPVR
jgi:hypothetical protein